jgi:hypothetical protein
VSDQLLDPVALSPTHQIRYGSTGRICRCVTPRAVMNITVKRKFLGPAINSTSAVQYEPSRLTGSAKKDSKQESAPDGYWEDTQADHRRLLPDIYLHTIHDNLAYLSRILNPYIMYRAFSTYHTALRRTVERLWLMMKAKVCLSDQGLFSGTTEIFVWKTPSKYVKS